MRDRNIMIDNGVAACLRIRRTFWSRQTQQRLGDEDCYGPNNGIPLEFVVPRAFGRTISIFLLMSFKNM